MHPMIVTYSLLLIVILGNIFILHTSGFMQFQAMENSKEYIVCSFACFLDT